MKYTLYLNVYVCLIEYFISFLFIFFTFKLFLLKFYLRVFILRIKKDEIFFFIISGTKDICNFKYHALIYIVFLLKFS